MYSVVNSLFAADMPTEDFCRCSIELILYSRSVAKRLLHSVYILAVVDICNCVFFYKCDLVSSRIEYEVIVHSFSKLFSFLSEVLHTKTMIHYCLLLILSAVLSM